MSSLESVQQAPALGKLPFRVGIVGGGRVGGALARALMPHVAWIVVRSPWRRVQLRHAEKTVPIVGSLAEVAVLPELVVVAVADRAIGEIAVTLARRFADQLAGKTVVHVSGALTASVLAPVSSFGAHVASAHPFTMIPEPDPAWLYGAVWGIEGDPQSYTRIESLVRMVGGTPYLLGPTDERRKALYHAAAVLASNVTTEAIALAEQVAEAAGIPASLFLPPILRATFDSAVAALTRGEPIARTGPAARGDVPTIEQHLAAMDRNEELRQRYRLLMAALLGTDGADRAQQLAR